MKSLKIRDVILGEGIPKICVPIVGVTREDILSEAERMAGIPVDVVEWRADWYEDVLDKEKVKDILKELRKILNDIPILFTFRTLREGGEKEIAPEKYAELNKMAAASGYVDLIDVEIYAENGIAQDLIKDIHFSGGKVIASNHDFEKTPEREEIVRRLCFMQEAGADILKIAVMPQSRRDVLVLLEATEEMREKYANCPVVTMAMGGIGGISRLSGEIFGSAMTFGSAGKASAPGQMRVEELSRILQMLHENM